MRKRHYQARGWKDSDTYELSATAFLEEVFRQALRQYDVRMRFSRHGAMRSDGLMYIVIGEGFNGQHEWHELPELPERSIYTDFGPAPVYTELPPRKTVYAHTCGIPALHRRTVRNRRSMGHLVRFLVRSWEQVKYQAVIE